MTILALVPARGGSRGIPRKNLAVVAGKTLLRWSIDAALASSVDRVVVSSDDEAILVEAWVAGAEPLRRPARLATDTAGSESVVEHCLEALATKGFVPDVIVLLQPTSPLRRGGDIDAALDLLRSSGADAVISVYEPRHSPYKCFVVDGRGFLRGLFGDDVPFRRRQDLPTCLMPNGAIYAVRTETFRRTGRLMGPNTVPYLMPEERSLDIDDTRDLEAAERALAS